ncbi:MAG: prolipoprotein diacylglyceryl transferase [Phycisphaerales bacterium]|jgi:phosphatidylglycerol:prolipoprotein diacylglycerol transferase|nr:prolipoprotein diacylglyceryl transferase [Phycisphaerales bacterium]
MWQEIYRLHLFGRDFPIYGYGLMLVIGFLVAVQLAKYLSRRKGIDPELFVNAGLLALIVGVIGSRLSHVLENLPDYTRSDLSFGQNFWNAINISSGGLTYYGGFLLAFPVLLLYAKVKKIPMRLGMDIIAPCLMVGLGFGRIGCFLNGCCYGAESNVAAVGAVEFPYRSIAYEDQWREGKIQPPPELIQTDGRHADLIPKQQLSGSDLILANEQHSLSVLPSQLYSTVTAWLIAATLVAYFSLGPASGRVFALMMMVEGLTRFLLEMLRVEPPVLGPLSLSMVLGLLLMIGGAILWAIFGRFGTETVANKNVAKARQNPTHHVHA